MFLFTVVEYKQLITFCNVVVDLRGVPYLLQAATSSKE